MSSSPTSSSDTRLPLLKSWLQGLPGSLGLAPDSLRSASDDASFRRYFRLDTSDPRRSTLIVMDAPPPQEDCRPFVHAASVMAQAGLTVPAVLAADLAQGFLLLEDFGNITYLQALDEHSAPALYRDASNSLIRLQLASRPGVFPAYDRALLARELDLYPVWYAERHRAYSLTDGERQILHKAFDLLTDAVLAQPSVYVHRDYHSRNLMRLAGDGNPGVLDFQDAVYGPYTYDLVSLLRDAYIQWPEEQVLDWVIRHWEAARKAGLVLPDDVGEFYREFEWMGLQRHLKVLGIFARLNHRDGKDRYLADLPRVLDYVIKTANRYRAFGPLVQVLDKIERRSATTGYTF